MFLVKILRNRKGLESGLARVGCKAGAATIRNGILCGESYNGEPEHIYFKIELHAFPIVIRRKESRPV
mgnify:CR=1 FL=1